ncbi:Photosystem I reaction center subunit III [Halomicronema hongdechloris C2206]|uniref:Photosystem I reaction center subunit III n=1 Tax=Halomicronema hongdechloris C2206 TaxID=1641165 RepID=A0A1Z3HIN7_9CYAN|nr:Photosystem I reaction center subunit III [Halomicronema hongdechloris]ASC70165.1 Photosystem I reaction center subunit III [Halomicronema hongdechloris C2206]
MRALFAIVIMSFVWFNAIPPAIAAGDTHLVPCQESTAFMENLQNAPKSYYFDQPYQAYSKNLLCGEDGLPHLQLRLDRAVDIAIPFVIFFYFAGFVGWSGRAYLINSKKASKPEEMEIFINVPLAIQSFIQGLLWPLAAFRELTAKELTAKDSELSVSPR